jgi:hypothetical protein
MEQQMNAAEAWGGQRAELSPHSCEKISREAIDGEATSLLTILSETNGEPNEARICIADKSGLPLKSGATFKMNGAALNVAVNQNRGFTLNRVQSAPS